MNVVFTNPNAAHDRVVTLDDESVQISDSIRPAGGDHSSPSLTGDERIAYAAVTSVRADRRRASMTIYHWDGSRTQLRPIEFQDASARDRALRSLHSRLGPSFCLQEVRYGPLRAAALPLLVAGGSAFFTWLSVGAVDQLENAQASVLRLNRIAEKLIFVGALKLLGPTGVMLVGAICIGLALRWLNLRIRRPPIMVKLSRRSQEVS